jgi:hypothetical protein
MIALPRLLSQMKRSTRANRQPMSMASFPMDWPDRSILYRA